jgi:hypothetical protein
MPVTTIGTTGVVWGITAEGGMLVQSVTAKITREKNQVRNEAGEFVALAFYNALQTYSLNAVLIKPQTQLGTVSPGFAFNLANVHIGNGVTTGGIYCDDVEIAKSNTEFQKITVNATQYPLIQ